MKYDEFITKVGGRADVSLETADALTAATLQTLAERISGGEAAQLAKYLPDELKPHLTGAEEARAALRLPWVRPTGRRARRNGPGASGERHSSGVRHVARGDTTGGAPRRPRPAPQGLLEPRRRQAVTEHRPGSLDDVLVLGGGFSEADRPLVRERLSTLEKHLSRWDPASVTVEVSVKNRGGREQQVTLRAELPGYPPLVAKVVDPNLDSALASAKRELIRQVEDEKTKREPKSNRQLRHKPV